MAIITIDQERTANLNKAISLARKDDSIMAAAGGATASPMAILKVIADRKREKFNSHLGKEGVAPSDTDLLMSEMMAAVNNYNYYAVLEHLYHLQATSPVDAMKQYLESQMVKGIKASVDPKTYRLSFTESNVPVSFRNFISVTRLPELDGLLDAVAIITDNIARNDAKDAGAYISRHPMTEKYRDLRARMGWEKYTNKNEIVNQLNELVNDFLLPKGFPEIKMIKADVNYIRTAAINAKDTVDKVGYFTQRNDETILNFIFRAVYTRYNNASYEFQKFRSALSDPYTAEHSAPNTGAPKSDEAKAASPVTVSKADPAETSASDPVESALKSDIVEGAKAAAADKVESAN